MALFGTPTSRFSTSADKDIEVPQPPGDSISSLAFSNQADYLAVGSWDNSVCTSKFHARKQQFSHRLGSNLRCRYQWSSAGKSHVSA